MERFRINGDRLFVKISEDLDHCLTEQIRGKIDDAIEQNGILHIVFDFDGMNFMDSAGIGFIMGRYKKVYLRGGSVSITGINPAVDRILRISGLYKIVNLPVQSI